MKHELDFVERLNFFLETLYYDALNSKNIVLFNYDPSYPRAYDVDAKIIIKTLEAISKIFLTSLSGANIVINFKLTTYSIDVMYFNVIFSSNKQLHKPSELLIKQAKDLAKKSNSVLHVGRFEISLDTQMAIVRTSNIANNVRLASPLIRDYYAVVAYDDKNGVEILLSQLKNFGIKVSPSSDYQTLKKHVTDAIYRPSVVFIHKEYLRDQNELKTILMYKKIKNFSIVAICDKDDDFDADSKKEIFILRQPYAYDALVATLNACHKRRFLSHITKAN